MKIPVATALAALLLAGCNTTQTAMNAPPGTAVVAQSNLTMPGGSECAADIARYRALQKSELATGNVAQSVYNQMKNETAAAERVCAAGKDSEAREMITASRKRHGYPTEM